MSACPDAACTMCKGAGKVVVGTPPVAHDCPACTWGPAPRSQSEAEVTTCKVCDNDRRFVVGVGEQAYILACPACRGVDPETLTHDDRACVVAACKEAGVEPRWAPHPAGMDGRIVPGTEPSSSATRELALVSIGFFLAELVQCRAAIDRLELAPAYDGSGRWGGRIFSGTGRFVNIRMPGHEPRHLRYRGRPGECAYDFPRVIVAGVPLMWGHALSATARLLSETDDVEHAGAAHYLRVHYFGGG